MRLNEFLHLLRHEIALSEVVSEDVDFAVDDLEIDAVEINVAIGLGKSSDGEDIINVMHKDDKNVVGNLKIELSEWEPDDEDYDDVDMDDFDDSLELDPSDEKFLSFLNKLGSDGEKEEK